MKKIIFLFAMTLLLLSFSCSKEEMITFDVTVMNKDSSAVTEGYVQIFATQDGFTGLVTVFRKEISVENGKTYFETPFDPKIDDIQVSYWKSSNESPSQTIVGCNHEFDPATCLISGGQRKFVIDITLR